MEQKYRIPSRCESGLTQNSVRLFLKTLPFTSTFHKIGYSELNSLNFQLILLDTNDHVLRHSKHL